MGLLLDEVMRPINTIHDTTESIARLAELGPLIDERGAEFFSHAIFLLALIQSYAARLEDEMDALLRALRACHDRVG